MVNLAAIPLLLMLAMFADTDILQSILYLLKKPGKDSSSPKAFYGLTTEEAKNVATSSSTYATFVSLAALLGSGFLFDMMGRRPFLMGCFAITAIVTILFPVIGYTDSIMGFTFLRIGF
jgi:MFS family permease